MLAYVCISKKVKLSDCIDNMRAYTHLTDHVFHQILLSTDTKLKEVNSTYKVITAVVISRIL